MDDSDDFMSALSSDEDDILLNESGDESANGE
jgi:hypothetical protein